MRMDAATVTIVGRAVTAPTRSSTSAGDRVSFRVVSTERRYDQESKEWVDGDEFGVGVVCWRHLAGRVVDTVGVGDPIVVIGRISTRKFERNGATEYFTDVRADVVAVDVARMGSRFVRGRQGPDHASPEPGAPEAGGPHAALDGDGAVINETDPHADRSGVGPAPRADGSVELPWESRARRQIGEPVGAS